jgi:hypothetical protein
VADPWKVYGVGAPGWVNDLAALEYGQGYWIYVTQDVTLRLKGAPGTLPLTQAATNTFQSPPATYYGAVQASSGFTPAAEMTVLAYVRDAVCGRGRTLELNGQVVYAINVSADGPGAANCGVPGRKVTFQVDSRVMKPTTTWDNNQVSELQLR